MKDSAVNKVQTKPYLRAAASELEKEPCLHRIYGN